MNPNHCISIYLVVEYIYYSNKVYANKLILYSKFIGYEDNSYCSIYYIQENIILHSIHAIFDEEFLFKYTDSYVKECKLYNKLLNKISWETELLVSSFSSKDRPTSVSILHIPIPLIQNNPSCFPSPFLSYKFPSSLSFPGPKKPIVEIKEADNVDSDIEIQFLSPQQPLLSALQTLQEDPELRRSKH